MMISTSENPITEWIEIYSKPLLNRAMYLLSDREDAADLVQEVFLAAFSSFHLFKGSCQPLTWLTQILNNKVSDFYRQKYKEPTIIRLDHFFDENGSWEDDSVLSNWDSPYNTTSEDTELILTLENCLENLPPKWKIPVKLYYLLQKKAPDVCQETQISTTNLWKILQRSRLQLRECLEINWFEKK